MPNRKTIAWIYDVVQTTITRHERLILPDDDPKTWAELVNQKFAAHLINKRCASDMRRWLKSDRERKKRIAAKSFK
jgi:hypothetical protein